MQKSVFIFQQRKLNNINCVTLTSFEKAKENVFISKWYRTVLSPNRQVELFCTWLILLNMDGNILYTISVVFHANQQCIWCKNIKYAHTPPYSHRIRRLCAFSQNTFAVFSFTCIEFSIYFTFNSLFYNTFLHQMHWQF